MTSGRTLDAADELAVADEILLDAEDLAASKPRIAGREAYLAMFHAAQARIAASGSDVPKTHKGVSMMIAALYRGDAYRAQSILSDAEDWKQFADYGRGVPLAASDVIAAIDTARIFIGRMRADIIASGALDTVADPIDYESVMKRGEPGIR